MANIVQAEKILKKQYLDLKFKYKHYKAYLECQKEKLFKKDTEDIDENLFEELSTVYKDIPSLFLKVVCQIDYPFSPPLIKIHNTVPLFHPNIDSEGIVSLEILSTWSVTTNLLHLVESVEKILIEPDLRFVTNLQAAQEYENNKALYYLRAIDIALQTHEMNFPDFKNESF
jgi:ubiquitin-protein ligase